MQTKPTDARTECIIEASVCDDDNMRVSTSEAGFYPRVFLLASLSSREICLYKMSRDQHVCVNFLTCRPLSRM